MGLEKAASGVRTGDGMLLRLGPFFSGMYIFLQYVTVSCYFLL